MSEPEPETPDLVPSGDPRIVDSGPVHMQATSQTGDQLEQPDEQSDGEQ